jgi:hypothetical protein
VSNQEILDNAPDGATHVDSESDYYKINENVTEVMLNSLWFSAEDALILPIRSLADIKRIAELEKDLFTQSQESKDAVKRAIEIILEKDERIAELEQYYQMVVYAGFIMEDSEGVAGYHLNGDVADWDSLFTYSLYKEAVAKRDLEQQAKGVKDFFASVEPKISMGESKLWELQTHNVNCYLDNLRNQAKGGAE